MKTLKNILTVVLFASFFFSCTPNAINEDETPNTAELVATGDDTSTDVDEIRD